jgi:hypothetical protein
MGKGRMNRLLQHRNHSVLKGVWGNLGIGLEQQSSFAVNIPKIDYWVGGGGFC